MAFNRLHRGFACGGVALPLHNSAAELIYSLNIDILLSIY